MTMSEYCANRRNRLLRPRAVARGALALLVLAGVPAASAAPRAASASASERYLIEGLVDGEAWSTGQQSLLLSRNAGDPATEGRLRLWAAVQITRDLQGM